MEQKNSEGAAELAMQSVPYAIPARGLRTVRAFEKDFKIFKKSIDNCKNIYYTYEAVKLMQGCMGS